MAEEKAKQIGELERLKLQLFAERDEKFRIQLSHLDNIRQQTMLALAQVSSERSAFADELKKKYGLGAGDEVRVDGTIAWAPVHSIDDKKAG